MHARTGRTAVSSWLGQSRLLAVSLVLLLGLAACGGGGDKKETPTAPASSPVAQRDTCQASVTDASGSPIAGAASPSLLEPPTREEFNSQLLAACPMSDAAQKGGTILLV